MLVGCSAVIDFFNPLDKGPFCSLCTSMLSALKDTISADWSVRGNSSAQRGPQVLIDEQKIL